MKKGLLTTFTFLAAWLISTTSTAQFGPSPWKPASGTFTVPAGVTSITVECQGGGGGGGGNSNPGFTYSMGGGGGGGAYSIISNYAVVPGQTIQVVVGAAGAKGASGGGTGGAGGLSSVAYNSTIFVSAAGGNGGGGASSAAGATGAGGAGGSSGIGILYNGGNGASGSNAGSGGGGGGAGSSGAGSNANTYSAGGGGFGNPFGGSGGAGKARVCDGWAAGGNGAVPGGGGGGTEGCGQVNGQGSYSSGGAGAAGQVTITYALNTTCTQPCNVGWINQSCTVCAGGCNIDAGTVAPTRTVQTASQLTDPVNYGYIFWTFTASKDSTYYFDLCSSTGTAGTSWLRLHKDRTGGSNYCLNVNGDTTLVLQNMDNGCAGMGTGLSKLIWTCRSSGTYYLETAVDANMTMWGVAGTQTAILSYKTLPSSSVVCSDIFYDKGITGTDGSAAAYNNNENWIYTYYPTDPVAKAIYAQIISFSSAPGDVLCVYDGNSVNAPQIGCIGGPSVVGAWSSTATDGSLTFEFTTDDTGVDLGWQIDISCVDNVGVGNYVSADKIRIFPNPVKDQLEISGIRFDEKTKIQIFDMIGKSIYVEQPSSQVTTHNSQPKTFINVSDLPSGVYSIQIENGNGKWNGKFVKQ